MTSNLLLWFVVQSLALLIFTALHWMQGGLVRRKLSVCPSLLLSNAWIVMKRKKEMHIILAGVLNIKL